MYDLYGIGLSEPKANESFANHCPTFVLRCLRFFFFVLAKFVS